MNVTYRVRFEDERRTRSRVFQDHDAARWWASRNRPDVDYVIVARYQNAFHAAIAFLLRRRVPTVSSRIDLADPPGVACSPVPETRPVRVTSMT